MRIFNKVKLPLNLQEEDKNKFLTSDSQQNILESPLSLSNITMISNGIFFKGHSISPLSFAAPSDFFLQHYVNLKFKIKQWAIYALSKTSVIENEALIITDIFSYNYYHWFIETMTRLHKFKDEFDNNLIVILPFNCKNREYIRESLKLYNLKTFYLESRFHKVRLKKILFLPHVYYVGNSKNELISDMSKFFLSKLESTNKFSYSERIFISRKKTRVRRILNEEEIASIVQKYGFEIVYMEDLSWIEQVQKMIYSKYLIAGHGAGLTNILFIKNKATIFELFPVRLNNTINTCFYFLSNTLGFDYYYQLRASQDKSGVKDGGDSNYIIDVELFEKHIKQILAE